MSNNCDIERRDVKTLVYKGCLTKGKWWKRKFNTTFFLSLYAAEHHLAFTMLMLLFHFGLSVQLNHCE